MQTITIIISSSALTISLISLIITLIQKYKETRRTIRKSLTDILESITKIAIDTSKLLGTKDYYFDSEPNILLRRNFNTQRRILIAHADYLIQRYNKIATDIDCNILAQAYAISGDQDNAEIFWIKTIEKSKSEPIKAMNLRGFGSFLFAIGKEKSGRKQFEESLSVILPENDSSNALVIDTYLMMADLEMDLGNKENFDLNIIKAIEILDKIKGKKRKKELDNRLRAKLPRS